MRRSWFVVIILVLAAGTWFWPYAGAYTLARAAERGDSAAVAQHIDFPALRRSLGRQIVRAYLKQSGHGDKMGNFGRNLAVAIGTTVADPYLASLLTPEALTGLLGRGHIGTISVDNRTIAFDRPMPRLSSLFDDGIGHVLLNSYYDGFASFRFSVPDAPGSTGAYGVHLRLSGMTWRLSGLDLPDDILDRLAADAMAKEKASGASAT